MSCISIVKEPWDIKTQDQPFLHLNFFFFFFFLIITIKNWKLQTGCPFLRHSFVGHLLLFLRLNILKYNFIFTCYKVTSLKRNVSELVKVVNIFFSLIKITFWGSPHLENHLFTSYLVYLYIICIHICVVCTMYVYASLNKYIIHYKADLVQTRASSIISTLPTLQL